MLKIGKTYRDEATGKSGKLMRVDDWRTRSMLLMIGGSPVRSLNLTRVHSNEYFFFVGLAFLLVAIAAFAG